MAGSSHFPLENLNSLPLPLETLDRGLENQAGVSFLLPLTSKKTLKEDSGGKEADNHK